MTRFTMPRAGRPVKTLVIAVCCAAALINAERWTALVDASGRRLDDRQLDAKELLQCHERGGAPASIGEIMQAP